jgi:hypothetical protein
MDVYAQAVTPAEEDTRQGGRDAAGRVQEGGLKVCAPDERELQAHFGSVSP